MKLNDRQIVVTHAIFALAVIVFASALYGDVRSESNSIGGVPFSNIGAMAFGIAIGILIYMSLAGGGAKSFIINVIAFFVLSFSTILLGTMWDHLVEKEFSTTAIFAVFILFSGCGGIIAFVIWLARLATRKR